MFGIKLADNFKRPYFSTSLGDFWRRWHISLGSWMRDYLFYPFATSKWMSRLCKAVKKKAQSIAYSLPAVLGNILVFVVVGLWHGAKWTYVFWGLYNGCVLAMTALADPLFKAFNKRFPKLQNKKSWYVFRLLRTFGIVCVGYYFDRANTIQNAFFMLKRTFQHPWKAQLIDGTLLQLGIVSKDYIVLAIALLVVFAVSLAQERGVALREWLEHRNIVLRWGVFYLLIFFIAAFAVTNVTELEAFLYAAF